MQTRLTRPGPPDASDLVDGQVMPDANTPWGAFWWMGARSTTASAIPNSGVRATLEVVDAPPESGCLSYWTSDTLDNRMWGQVGYSMCTYPGYPVYARTAFFQVWDLSVPPDGELLLDVDTTDLSLGLHSFSMAQQSGTTWAYAVDGVVLGTYDMKSAVADEPAGVATLCEEGDGVAEAFVPPAVAAPVAMEVLGSAGWGPASTAQAYNLMGVSGVVGRLQDAGLASDQVIIGGAAPMLPNGTALWDGTSLDGGIDAAVSDAAVSVPPFVAITCPSSNATFGGTVVISAEAHAPAGVAEVDFQVDSTNRCTVFAPPYTCAWDSTIGAGNGLHFVEARVLDTLGAQTWTYLPVNVDRSAPPACVQPRDAGRLVDAGAGAAGDSGPRDARSGDAARSSDAARDGGRDATVPRDAAFHDAARAAPPLVASGGGCGCRLVDSRDNRPRRALLAVAALGLAVAARRRRRSLLPSR